MAHQCQERGHPAQGCHPLSDSQPPPRDRKMKITKQTSHHQCRVSANPAWAVRPPDLSMGRAMEASVWEGPLRPGTDTDWVTARGPPAPRLLPTATTGHLLCLNQLSSHSKIQYHPCIELTGTGAQRGQDTCLGHMVGWGWHSGAKAPAFQQACPGGTIQWHCHLFPCCPTCSCLMRGRFLASLEHPSS